MVMLSLPTSFRALLSFIIFLSLLAASVLAQDEPTLPSPADPGPTTPAPTLSDASSITPSGSSPLPVIPTPIPSSSAPPDVLLHVPELSVGRIELNVDNLAANINLNAQVAGLVSINAGVAVSVQKVNITIADVRAELDLVVRLGNLVAIVNRVFESLDLNPLLLSAVGNVTDLLDNVVGSVDGLLGTITQGGNTLSFVVDNLGHIVQSLKDSAGVVTDTIVGDYLTNMTDTGVVKNLGNGLTQKTFSYSPLNALVNIVFNTAGQIVQAVVAKSTGGGGTPTPTPTPSGGSSSVVSPTATP